MFLTPAVISAEGVAELPEDAIRYGAWINTFVNLVIVGFVMFMIVKAYNKMKKPVVEEARCSCWTISRRIIS